MLLTDGTGCMDRPPPLDRLGKARPSIFIRKVQMSPFSVGDVTSGFDG